MNQTVHQPNFRELLAAHRLEMPQITRRLLNSNEPVRNKLLGNALLIGHAIGDEVSRIAQLIGCSEEEIVAALAESAKDPGEDPRGRKKGEVTHEEAIETKKRRRNGS
mgnify:CR=1 FL=1